MLQLVFQWMVNAASAALYSVFLIHVTIAQNIELAIEEYEQFTTTNEQHIAASVAERL